MQIVVVGMHRSGTSALTRILGLMGCWLGEPGDFNPVEPDNPKGYWERRDVWALNEAMLASQDATWWQVADLSLDRWTPETRRGFEEQARAIVERLDEHGTWAIKDPRFCLLLPVWRKVLTRPVFLLMARRPLQVARSLQTRDGFPLAVGAALWEKHLLAAFENTAGCPRLLVNHLQLMGDPATTAADLLAGLESFGARGLHLPEPEALREFVDVALFRAHGSGDEEASLLNPVQREVWNAISDGSAVERGDWPAPSTGCDDLLRSWAHRRDEEARLAALERRVQESTAAESRLTELENAHAEACRHADALKQQVASLTTHLQSAEAQVASLTTHLQSAEAQVASLTTHLQSAEAQVASLTTHLRTSEDQVRELSAELRAALQRGADLRERARTAEARAARTDELAAHADALYNELRRAANLFDQQHALLDLVLHSRRYRLAKAAGETARRLTLRGPQPAAAEHAARILAEYEAWRRALVERHGLPPLDSIGAQA